MDHGSHSPAGHLGHTNGLHNCLDFNGAAIISDQQLRTLRCVRYDERSVGKSQMIIGHGQLLTGLSRIVHI